MLYNLDGCGFIDHVIASQVLASKADQLHTPTKYYDTMAMEDVPTLFFNWQDLSEMAGLGGKHPASGWAGPVVQQ